MVHRNSATYWINARKMMRYNADHTSSKAFRRMYEKAVQKADYELEKLRQRAGVLYRLNERVG